MHWPVDWCAPRSPCNYASPHHKSPWGAIHTGMRHDADDRQLSLLHPGGHRGGSGRIRCVIGIRNIRKSHACRRTTFDQTETKCHSLTQGVGIVRQYGSKGARPLLGAYLPDHVRRIKGIRRVVHGGKTGQSGAPPDAIGCNIARHAYRTNRHRQQCHSAAATATSALEAGRALRLAFQIEQVWIGFFHQRFSSDSRICTTQTAGSSPLHPPALSANPMRAL